MGRLTLANISKHLSDEFINKIFNFRTNSDENVITIEISPAAPPGEGMISAVYRIKVVGAINTVNFIAKGLVNDTLLRKSLRSEVLFKREALFFSSILPVLIEIQQSLGAKEHIQDYVPVCYGCLVDGKHDYILMEDVAEKQFTSISKNPTVRERELTLKTLAHLHSVSFALRIKKPDVFTKITNELTEVYYNDCNRNWFANYLQSALTIDNDVLIELEGTNSIYYKKFQQAVNDDIYGQIIKLLTTKGDHPVVSHGDAWCPNFLCSQEKAIAIDFQLLRCGSPALDLSYFIIMCSNLCHNKEDFVEAVEVYYKALDFFLNDMGINANVTFSLDSLKEELNKYGRFGFFAALTSIPLLASERCDVLQSFEVRFPGCEEIPLEKIWQLSPIKSHEHKIRIVNAIRVAVDVGLL